MSDALTDSQVLGIWERTKVDIDYKRIMSVDPMNQQKELQKLLENPKRKSKQMETLAENNFSSKFIENQVIRDEILSNAIREVNIKGKSRFQVKGNQRQARGGRFLKGRTRQEALDDLKRKLGE